MTAQELLALAMGPVGAMALLCLFVVFIVAGKFVVPFYVYEQERRRVTKLDEQNDEFLELLRKIITNQEMADERERLHRERGG